jgi:hypothetical protein
MRGQTPEYKRQIKGMKTSRLFKSGIVRWERRKDNRGDRFGMRMGN